MKKGKTSQIQGFKTAKVVYGTVDSVNFKSLYLNIQTWVEPKINSENWNRIVLNLSRFIKHSVLDSLDKTLFDNKFIVDLDLRSSGLQKGKKSFLNLEINFYLTGDENDFKSRRLKESLKKICKQVFHDNFTNNENFKLQLTKTKKTKVEKIETNNL
jgi:hypothetical protein